MIEPFPGYIDAGTTAHRVLGGLSFELDGLPEKSFVELVLPAEDLVGVHGERERTRIDGEVRDLILKLTPGLDSSSRRLGNDRVALEIGGFERRSWLIRHAIGSTESLHQHVVVGLLRPEGDPEDHRQERIRRAVGTKVPKLMDAAKQASARSVLVLESNDMSMTRPDLVLPPLKQECEVLASVHGLPDAVVFISSGALAWRFRDGDWASDPPMEFLPAGRLAEETE